jgi:hypothetical protein
VLSVIPEFTEHVYLKVTRMLEDTKRLIGRKTHNAMVKEKKGKLLTFSSMLWVMLLSNAVTYL